jgi:uncharacterized membrane protein
MSSPKALLLAAAVSVSGCAEATFEPTRQAGDLLQTQYDAQQYEVRDLGTFGGAPTIALDIDKHGAVFGRYGTGLAQRSFRWTEAGGYQDLGEIGGSAFQLLTANDHGLLNGSVFTAAGPRAAAWVPHTGFVLLDPDFSGTSLGNNDRGVVAGTRNEAGGVTRAILWSAKHGLAFVPVQIEDASSIRSGAADLNNHGVVAGQVSFLRAGVVNRRAFIWNEARGTTLIPALGPGDVGVTYVSDEGLVIGASHTRRPMPGEVATTPLASNPGTIPTRAWKWSAEGGLVELGTLGGNHSVAWNADRDGNVYGWASDAAGVQHAVKWTVDGGVVDLGGLGGNSVTGGINKHGVVVGWSVGADGVGHAVSFTPRKKKQDAEPS